MILVISSKKVFAAKRLKLEASSQKLKVRVMDVRDLAARKFKVDIKKFNVLYIRDPFFEGTPKYVPQIIKLAKQFKRLGKRVVDSVIADGELGQGKWEDYQKLMKMNLPIPWTNLFSDYSLLTTHYPLILKWVYGFKAQNVFLINNKAELKTNLPLHPKKEWLVQEFIKAEYEYKVITVGYKALPAVLRFKILDSGFRTDFDTACSVPINRLPKVTALAETASKLLGRELAKVDILEAKGKFYILEVNRFPGLKSFEELTKSNAFKEFLGYLQKP